MSQSDGKTEKATPRRREDERKKGNIFQSRDATTAISLVAMIAVFKIGGGWIMGRMEQVVLTAMSSLDVESVGVQSAADMLRGFVLDAAVLILPVTGLAMLFGVALTGIQTRFLVTPSLLAPKFSRMNPLSGLKNMFSKKTLVELLKSVLKIIVIGQVFYGAIQSGMSVMTHTALLDPVSSMKWLAELTFDTALRAAMFMAILSLADFMYQWWDYEKRLRMTKEEIKEESKRMEGNPQTKGRIRSVQRKMSMARMMHQVPGATVVIKNPTHYAVALRYNPPADASPVVVAKGKDLVAYRIIRKAEEHGVYVTENRPLARGLYEAVELNRQIPEEFFKPVADIIAFIYNLKKRHS